MSGVRTEDLASASSSCVSLSALVVSQLALISLSSGSSRSSSASSLQLSRIQLAFSFQLTTPSAPLVPARNTHSSRLLLAFSSVPQLALFLRSQLSSGSCSQLLTFSRDPQLATHSSLPLPLFLALSCVLQLAIWISPPARRSFSFSSRLASPPSARVSPRRLQLAGPCSRLSAGISPLVPTACCLSALSLSCAFPLRLASPPSLFSALVPFSSARLLSLKRCRFCFTSLSWYF